jgi:hypothetical protein
MTTEEKLERVRSILKAVDAWPQPPHILLEKALREHRYRKECGRQWWNWKRPFNSYIIELEHGKSISLSYSILEAFDHYCVECGTNALLFTDVATMDRHAEGSGPADAGQYHKTQNAV